MESGRIEADGVAGRPIRTISAAALAYWAVTSLSLLATGGLDGAAAMWPASGVLLAALLLVPARFAPATLLACAAGSILANLGMGTNLPMAAGITGADLVGGWLGAVLIRRWGIARPSFIKPRDVARFTTATVIGGVVNAAIWAVVGGTGWQSILSWFTTDTLGMLVVAPMVLTTAALYDPAEARVGRPRSGGEAIALLALVAAVTLAVFSQSRFPLLFLPMVALLIATYRLGPFGAAGGVTIVATVASLAISRGLHATHFLAGPPIATAFFLQFYLLVLFATALPFAAIQSARARLTAERAESERHHRLLAEWSSDIIGRISVDGVVVYASPAVQRVLGFTPDEVLSQGPMDLIHPDDRETVLANWRGLVAGRPGHDVCVYRQRRRDGAYVWLEAAYRLVPVQQTEGRPADGQGAEVIVSVRDISRRRQAELRADAAMHELRDANRLLEMAARIAGVGHWRYSIATETLAWSAEVFRLHGLSATDPQPTLEQAIAFYHPDDMVQVRSVVHAAMAQGGEFECAARVCGGDGLVHHVVVRGRGEMAADGSPAALFGIIRDVTEQVESEAELRAAHLAAEELAERAQRLVDIDALTGVASRRRALAMLDEALATAMGQGQPLAVAVLDIDHFKQVNDRWGHGEGDRVLRRVARAATEAVRATDLVGRLGGEEFVVIFPGAGQAVALTLVERLRTAIATSAAHPADGPPVTASIGIALYRPGATATSLLGDADRALYRAKAEGRNAAHLAA